MTSLFQPAIEAQLADTQLMKLCDAIDWDGIDARLDEIVPPAVLVPAAALHRNGRMFRALLLGCWHGLTDPQLALALRVRIDFLYFAGFELHEPKPDVTTIGRFRDWFGHIGLLDAEMACITAQLGRSGIQVRAADRAIVELTIADVAQSDALAACSAAARCRSTSGLLECPGLA